MKAFLLLFMIGIPALFIGGSLYWLFTQAFSKFLSF